MLTGHGVTEPFTLKGPPEGFSLCCGALGLILGTALSLQVVVKMDAVKELCTAETTARAVQQLLLAKGNSATPAFFSVVPLTVGEIPITITAFDQASEHSDSIRKNLKVVVRMTNEGQARHKYVLVLKYNTQRQTNIDYLISYFSFKIIKGRTHLEKMTFQVPTQTHYSTQVIH